LGQGRDVEDGVGGVCVSVCKIMHVSFKLPGDVDIVGSWTTLCAQPHMLKQTAKALELESNT
jgi:hypothetical protein